jgi:hypothetical protein
MTDRRSAPTDGDTKRCPQCGGTLVFSSRYPVLSIGAARRDTPDKDRMHYERAWICRDAGCDYHELLGDAA